MISSSMNDVQCLWRMFATVIAINARGLGWKALLRIRNESRLQLLGHTCILRLIGLLLNPYQLVVFVTEK